MGKIRNASILFSIGSVGYCLLEVMWRGYTHWTMGVTGGFCFLSLYKVNKKMRMRHLWEKCLTGCGIITCFEFCVGILVNKVLHWNVWDYSDQRGNILGQICPQYSILWFFLCMPLCHFTKKMEKLLTSIPSLSFFRQITSK